MTQQNVANQTEHIECYECGQGHTDASAMLEHDGEFYCIDCHARLFFKCHSCNKWHSKDNGLADPDGDLLCEDCWNEQCSTCDQCLCTVYQDDFYWSNSRVRGFCPACKDRHLIFCDGCSEEIPPHEHYCVHGYNYCVACYDDRYTSCDECEEPVCNDDICYDDENDRRLCQDCWDGANRKAIDVTSTTFDSTLGYNTCYGVEMECFKHNSVPTGMSKYISPGEDGSIHAPTNYRGIEYRTGIFQGNAGMEILGQFLESLDKHAVNRSCGLHVHVDARDMTQHELYNVAQFFNVFDDAIFSLVARSRRDNHYCQTLPWASGLTWQSAMRFFRSYGRYYGANFCAFAEHGTIEFRYHQGSLDYRKIRYWIRFCLAVVNRGKQHPWDKWTSRLKPSRKTIKTMLHHLNLPKADRRYWLGRFEHFAKGGN